MSERLPFQMLAGLLGGLALGTAAHALLAGSPAVDALVRYAIEPAGQIFLRLLFVLVIPLVVSALALSIADLGDLRRVGRIGLRTLAYTAAVSTIAVAIGVTLVNVFEPGRRPRPRAARAARRGRAAAGGRERRGPQRRRLPRSTWCPRTRSRRWPTATCSR